PVEAALAREQIADRAIRVRGRGDFGDACDRGRLVALERGVEREGRTGHGRAVRARGAYECLRRTREIGIDGERGGGAGHRRRFAQGFLQRALVRKRGATRERQRPNQDEPEWLHAIRLTDPRRRTRRTCAGAVGRRRTVSDRNPSPHERSWYRHPCGGFDEAWVWRNPGDSGAGAA